MKWALIIIGVLLITYVIYRISKKGSICIMPSPALAVPLMGKMTITGKCMFPNVTEGADLV